MGGWARDHLRNNRWAAAAADAATGVSCRSRWRRQDGGDIPGQKCFEGHRRGDVGGVFGGDLLECGERFGRGCKRATDVHLECAREPRPQWRGEGLIVTERTALSRLGQQISQLARELVVPQRTAEDDARGRRRRYRSRRPAGRSAGCRRLAASRRGTHATAARARTASAPPPRHRRARRSPGVRSASRSSRSGPTRPCAASRAFSCRSTSAGTSCRIRHSAALISSCNPRSSATRRISDSRVPSTWSETRASADECGCARSTRRTLGVVAVPEIRQPRNALAQGEFKRRHGGQGRIDAQDLHEVPRRGVGRHDAITETVREQWRFRMSGGAEASRRLNGSRSRKRHTPQRCATGGPAVRMKKP